MGDRYKELRDPISWKLDGAYFERPWGGYKTWLQGTKWLCWSEANPGRPIRGVSGPEGLLESFLKLATGSRAPSERRVLSFSRRWGVLRLSGAEGLPVLVIPLSRSCPWKLQPGPSERSYREPIAAWQRYAHAADALLTLAERVCLGGSFNQQECSRLLHPWLSRTLAKREGKSSPHWGDFEATTTRKLWEGRGARMLLAREIEAWMDLGDIRYRPIRNLDSSVYLAVSGEGLFGELALQLVRAAAHERAVRVCAGCPEKFEPGIRGNGRIYCKTCRADNVPGRKRVQKWRAPK